MDFGVEVINWYGVNKRDLPWRHTQDPYLIWLSEVILQQTRVAQGLPYFYSFSEQYPTVADLAAASEDEVLKLWQGLGYYSRGRNMHHTAKAVVNDHNARFPVSYPVLLGLKGIGSYTAAAISSFAGNEPQAVVDGNVFRLLSRFFGISTAIDSGTGKKQFTALANELIDKEHPGLFNQAVMEFGSLVCKPKNPDCEICPLRPGCYAYETGTISELPVKSKKQVVKNRFFNYIVVERQGNLLMHKRGRGDIWQHLYELPLVETPAAVSPAELLADPAYTGLFGEETRIEQVSAPVTHLLSHQKITALFIRVSGFKEEFQKNTNWFFASPDDLATLAQPKLIFAFLKNYPDFHSNQL